LNIIALRWRFGIIASAPLVGYLEQQRAIHTLIASLLRCERRAAPA
jgi:hypothetical protein